MDTRVLQYFLMTAREENITRAAQLLHITQPTLSRQLMQLEEELETKLFDRSNHNIVLTEEGITFQRRARDIVALAEKAKSEVAQNEDTLTGTVSIGCGELKSVRELAGWISAFQKMYPHVRFEIYSGSNEEIQERMDQGSLELGLFLQPFQVSKYTSIPMETKEKWGVLVHRESFLAEKKEICPEEFAGIWPVTTHANASAHMELMKWSADFARKIEFSINYNVLHNAVIVAREQKGAVICLEPDCQYDEMIFLPFAPERLADSSLAWREERRCSRATRAFIRFLQEEKAVKKG